MPEQPETNAYLTDATPRDRDVPMAYAAEKFPNNPQYGRWLVKLAYQMSDPLHYSIGEPSCRATADNRLCLMCLNAARLAVQALAPMVTDDAVARIQALFGVRCELAHPGDD